MTDESAERRPGPFVLVLITVRFLLELALWSSFTVSLVRLIDGPLGWVFGLLLSAVVIALWAVLLSPRRLIRLPVAVRVTIELILFAAAAALLAAAGLAGAGIALFVLELLDLGLLQGPDKNAI